MLTRMTDEDWATVLEVFGARSRRGAKGRDDRTFLEAIHSSSVHTAAQSRAFEMHLLASRKSPILQDGDKGQSPPP
jgi:hypothetical protein